MNRSYTGRRISRAAAWRPWLTLRRARLRAIRNSQNKAPCSRAISAARTLQPLWSQPEAKPGRFEDGLDAAKNRFAGIVTDLDLDTPKELAQ